MMISMANIPSMCTSCAVCDDDTYDAYIGYCVCAIYVLAMIGFLRIYHFVLIYGCRLMYIFK